jgi:transcriptional regulator with XRE-family HTH domain
VTAAGHSFGRRLRDVRERKGIALEAVAESTKIKMSLLVGLERGDVSRWPNAIFRRAFVREYAAAIGLQPATVLEEFLKLFPEDGGAADAARQIEGSLRLTLAVDETPLNRAMAANVLAAALDVAAILVLALGISRFSGTGFWATTGVAGLIYYSATTVWLGRSVASWWFNGRLAPHAKRSAVATVPHVMTPDRFHIVSRRDPLHVAAPLAPELAQTSDTSPPAALAAHR